jgi:hypothetical protein
MTRQYLTPQQAAQACAIIVAEIRRDMERAAAQRADDELHEIARYGRTGLCGYAKWWIEMEGRK